MTDDMREAPSLVIIELLLKAGATVIAYDPVAVHEAKKILGDSIIYADDYYDALQDADALMVITEWPEFRFPQLTRMGELLNTKVVFDGRNIYEAADMIAAGFDYFCIGQKIKENRPAKTK